MQNQNQSPYFNQNTGKNSNYMNVEGYSNMKNQYERFEAIPNFHNPNTYVSDNQIFDNTNMNKVKGFIDARPMGYSAPVEWNTGGGVLGSYDNLLLKTQCSEGWKGPPCNPPPKSKTQIVFQGTPLPLKNEEIYSELPQDSMFIMSRSVSDPFSVPRTFSSDRGYVQLTPLQEKYIGEMRGGNKTYENYYF